MKRIMIILALAAMCIASASAALPKVYDENVEPMAQIDAALQAASQDGKFVICQVGGNWCPWCLKFAAFITADDEIARLVADNYVYIHVNYPRDGSAADDLLRRLEGAGRFGYPVMVVMNPEGKVLHIQDSALLEKDSSYDREKVLRFFNAWTPAAVGEFAK